MRPRRKRESDQGRLSCGHAVLSGFLRAAFLALVPLAIAVCGHLAPASAKAPARLTCTGDLYQVQSGQLRIFDTNTSTYTDIGPKNPSYNSLAYNPQDDLLYATRDKRIVQVDANGIMTEMFQIGFNSYIGDIDDDNNIYLRRSGTVMTRVNLITREITDIRLSQALPRGTADWAFVDTPMGRRLVAPGQTQLSLINAENGQNRVVAIANFPAEGSSGATWSDANGRVFTFRNTTGNVYEILDYLTPNPRAVLVAIGDPSNSNDGSSCRKRPFPNFPPIAFDDTYQTRFQTPLEGVNMILGDGISIDNDPDGTPVTVQPNLIAQPQNGTIDFQPDGSFVYVPENNFSGIDQFTYRIVDASGLTADAVVSITVTRPKLDVEKQSTLHVASATSSMMTPGNDVIYNIRISNSGDQEADPDTLLIIDRWPEDLLFHFGDLDAGGSSQFSGADPVAWDDDGSGLDFRFDRDVRFSSSAARPNDISQCNYQPSSGYDPNVRFICITPKGALLPSGSAEFYMRGRID